MRSKSPFDSQDRHFLVFKWKVRLIFRYLMSKVNLGKYSGMLQDPTQEAHVDCFDYDRGFSLYIVIPNAPYEFVYQNGLIVEVLVRSTPIFMGTARLLHVDTPA